MNFSNDKYKNIAINFKFDENRVHSPEDAFFLIINEMDFDELSNLCLKIQSRYPGISLEECYLLTQNYSLDKDMKKEILDCAYECINEGKYLGTKTILGGKINASSWLSHSLNVSIVTSILAKNLGLNFEVAQTMGLLHDFGRKYSHNFNHIINGFEKLIDYGYYSEAIGSLTHSFVNGGRCANNEPAIEGFNLDEYGNPFFEKETNKDDITLFLEKYRYNGYDMLLNIADLIATDKSIVSLKERLDDIATRRVIDLKNREYFLSEIINLLNYILYNCQYIDNFEKISPNEKNMEGILKNTSDKFYKFFNNLKSSKKSIKM